jgi:hypothetical protein
MKNKYWLYILLVCLLAVSVYTLINRKAGTFKGNENRFAVRDTGNINQIEIRSKESSVILERMQGRWTVNGKYSAGSRKIRGLLMVISRLQVSAPVPGAIRDEIKGRLEEDGKIVKVITGKGNPQVILMYQDTIHSKVTYMMLEHSDQPFRIEIPGYPGRNLAGLFVDEAGYWRDNSIFSLREDEIISVTRYNRLQPGKSFYLVNAKGSGYKLFTYSDSMEIKNFDKGQVRQYLGYFASVSFERYLSDQEKADQRALKEDSPDDIITLRDSRNNITKVATFPLYVTGQQGQPKPDINRLIIVINDEDSVVASYVELDPVIKDIGYFLEKEKNNLYN